MQRKKLTVLTSYGTPKAEIVPIGYNFGMDTVGNCICLTDGTGGTLIKVELVLDAHAEDTRDTTVPS